MGCGSSTDSPQIGDRRKSSASIRRWSLIRKHKVSLKSGSGIAVTPDYPKIIFIFGGPGSMKGRLLEDLTSMFGLIVISAENIIMREFGKRIEDADKSDLSWLTADYLKKDSSALTLDWLLNEVTKEIQSDPDNIYVVDIVPNLKVLVALTSLVNNCRICMEKFESKFPVSFALNLKLSMKIAPQMEQVVHCAEAKSAEDKAKEEEKEKEKDKKGNATPEKKDKKSDEANKANTQNRKRLYNSNAAHFLKYFSASERLAELDMSCRLLEPILDRTCSFFQDMEINYVRSLDSVVVFVFNQSQMDRLRPAEYCMLSLHIEEIVSDVTNPLEKMIVDISNFIDASDPLQKEFCINVEGSSFATKEAEMGAKKTISFIHPTVDKLENYVAPRIKTTRCPYKFSVMHTSDSEALLFPQDTSLVLVKRVAYLFTKQRHH